MPSGDRENVPTCYCGGPRVFGYHWVNQEILEKPQTLDTEQTGLSFYFILNTFTIHTGIQHNGA